ncbi:MAG: hypothetical protein KGL59_01805 [Acidobacteriota bacterium]|nr:hypothetical protein [Acidobacteriota bacterium]
MKSIGKPLLVSLMTALMILPPALSPSALAQTATPQSEHHVVSTADLQKDVAAAAAARRANEAKVEAFLSTPRARQELKKVGMNYSVVQRAIPQLSRDELASLAARVDKAQKEFQAGSLTNQQITYIIIALATAVVVILIVKA